jgi:carboxylate-amine ligase
MRDELAFTGNESPTIGIELELMLADPATLDLQPSAIPLHRSALAAGLDGHVSLEITQSMIEVNTSAHTRHGELLAELVALSRVLQECARKHGTLLCGGGTHPFHRWQERTLSPSARFQEVGRRYGYLAKQFTVFGQHAHVGVADGDAAIATIQRLATFVPHFIALAASSPFHRSTDTTFDCCRLNMLSAFPLSGCMPPLETWNDFTRLFARLSRLGVANRVKDLYWDMRPKPETGTVELRVLDTPLDLTLAADLAAYFQVLVVWSERLRRPDWLDDFVYRHNRFQASRHGLDAQVIAGPLGERLSIADHVRYTLDRAAGVARELGCDAALDRIAVRAENRINDAVRLRGCFAETQSFRDVVAHSVRCLEESIRTACRPGCSADVVGAEHAVVATMA